MTTPIRGRDLLSGSAYEAIYRLSPNDVRPWNTAEYVGTLIALCETHGLRATVLLAQAWHETGAFGPDGRWDELNPAGLGITNSADATPYKITSGIEAARLHVWSMLVALREWESAEKVDLAPSAASWRARWGAKYSDPGCPIVRNVEDLNQMYQGNRATWATDPKYGEKVLGAMARLFPEAGESGGNAMVTFGRVPHPDFQDRPITKPEGVGQDNLGKRSVKGVVWHRILGSLWGTDSYFRRNDVEALTDYGVGVLAQDGATNDGLILRWNDPLGYQSGWASGRVIAPWGDGLAFVNKYGVNSVNRNQVSVEISGYYGTALSEKSRQSIAALTAHYADQYKIPWDVFPIAPQDGFSFVRWHQEFTGPQEKVCPGEVVMAETDELIERTRAILKQYQEDGEPVPEPEPPPKHTIPEGETFESLRRYYGTFVHPVTGKEERFDLGRAPSQFWLAEGKKTGKWPEANEIVIRGNGNERYRWEGGLWWERENQS